MSFFNNLRKYPARKNRRNTSNRRNQLCSGFARGARFETLEDRRMLAIVTVDPVDYGGTFSVLNSTMNLGTGSGLTNYDLDPGSYRLRIGNPLGTDINFTVDAAGNVSPTSRPTSVDVVNNVLTFNNTTVHYDPVNYTGAYTVVQSVRGQQDVVVVPDLGWSLRVGTPGQVINYFVDANGVVNNISNPEAFVAIGDTITFNNVPVAIDPQAYEGVYGVYGQLPGAIRGEFSFVAVPNLYYQVRIAGSDQNDVFLFVDAEGKVSTGSSPDKVTVENNVFTFKNSSLTIDPGDYTGSYRVPGLTNDFQTGFVNTTVVPSLWYRIQVPTSPDGEFTSFFVDASGNPSPSEVMRDINGEEIVVRLYNSDCDTPISAWHADGDALDAEGHNDGQLLNGVTFAPGQIGQAFELDGVDDAVQIDEDGSELDGFSYLTLTAWVNPDNFDPDPFGDQSDANGIVTKYDSRPGHGVSYALTTRDNGFLNFSISGSTGFAAVISDDPVVPVDAWTHVSGVWRGGLDLTLYVNGVQVPVSLVAGSTAIASMNNNDTSVDIGRFHSFSGSFTNAAGIFDGQIDDVRIYSCGLDEAHIQEIYLEGANQPVNVTGRVYDDANNDSSDTGDFGLGGLTVTLTGSDDNGPVNLTTTTLTDGTYLFEDVLPGTYSITAEQPAGLLDGQETAGNLGGTVDNTQDSNTISGIVIGTGGVDATGYNFANIQPSDLQGLVWQDFNNDGQVNFGEKAIAGVSLVLTGTDDRGNPVSLPAQTDLNGIYMFVDLRPGQYTVTETQPDGFDDGLDVAGTVNGSTVGDNSVNDVISGIVISAPGSVAENYNFGERPPGGGAVTAGQTATIGFWQNNNGQALIESLNGGGNSTQLSEWLSSTFVNMYGDDGVGATNANDLTGMTNSEVASFYSDLFRRKKKEAVQLGLAGPEKMDAQVLAVALATYVTNQSLAGWVAQGYGFEVTEAGLGTVTFNVGDGGQAFDVADDTDVAVLDLLFATDDNSQDGVLYDLDGDGDADDSWEALLRELANDVFSAINEQGDI